MYQLSINCGSLNLLEPRGPVKACTEMAKRYLMCRDILYLTVKLMSLQSSTKPFSFHITLRIFDSGADVRTDENISVND